jgi:protein Jade-1
VMPDYRKRRDSRFNCDLIKGDLKDKFFKESQASQVHRYVPEAHRHKSCHLPWTWAVSTGTSGETVPKCNGCLIKVRSHQPAAKVPTTPSSPAKNWSRFQIPYKGGASATGRGPAGTLPPACRLPIPRFGPSASQGKGQKQITNQ